MATILNYVTPDGVVAIEVDDVPSTASPYTRKGLAGVDRTIIAAEKSLDSALCTIRSAADAFARTIDQIDIKPEEADLSFSLKFTADAGIVFAKLEGEAQFRINMKWKRPSSLNKTNEGS